MKDFRTSIKKGSTNIDNLDLPSDVKYKWENMYEFSNLVFKEKYDLDMDRLINDAIEEEAVQVSLWYVVSDWIKGETSLNIRDIMLKINKEVLVGMHDDLLIKHGLLSENGISSERGKDDDFGDIDENDEFGDEFDDEFGGEFGKTFDDFSDIGETNFGLNPFGFGGIDDNDKFSLNPLGFGNIENSFSLDTCDFSDLDDAFDELDDLDENEDIDETLFFEKEHDDPDPNLPFEDIPSDLKDELPFENYDLWTSKIDRENMDNYIKLISDDTVYFGWFPAVRDIDLPVLINHLEKFLDNKKISSDITYDFCIDFFEYMRECALSKLNFKYTTLDMFKEYVKRKEKSIRDDKFIKSIFASGNSGDREEDYIDWLYSEMRKSKFKLQTLVNVIDQRFR